MGKLGDKEMNQLEQWIMTGPKTFTLLYSITKDGCSAKTFHKKCDNQGPTVTVLYNKQGSVFGGYTGVDWKSKGGFVTDPNAFLYRLYLNGRYTPVKFPRTFRSKWDIYCDSDCGPTFGYAYDLCTFKEAIYQSRDGLYKLNGYIKTCKHSYNMQGVHLADGDDGQLDVRELEVYRVTDGERNLLLETPWRVTPDWDEQFLMRLLDKVQSFQPPDVELADMANLLLIGPVGAGKSSFINTLNSIMAGEITQPARSGSEEQSLTPVYRQHSLKTPSGTTLKFRLCDTRGLGDSQGLDVLEFDSLLNGHIPNFYEFIPTSPITQDHPSFIAQPRPSDKINCAVFVIKGTTLDVAAGKVMQKMKSFIARLNQKGIPSVVLMTHVDSLCPHVEAAVSNVFRSSKVKDEVEKAADTFGLPRINVMPVKNYENEISTQEDISILTLLAVEKILNFAADHLRLLGEKFEHQRGRQGTNADV